MDRDPCGDCRACQTAHVGQRVEMAAIGMDPPAEVPVRPHQFRGFPSVEELAGLAESMVLRVLHAKA